MKRAPCSLRCDPVLGDSAMSEVCEDAVHPDPPEGATDTAQHRGASSNAPRFRFVSPPVWLAALTGGVLAVSFVLPHGAVDRLRLCVWHHVLGVTCPFCGMSRGFVALSHGDVASAIAFNPASPLIYAAFLWMLGASVWAMAMGRWDDGPRAPAWLRFPFYFTAIPLFAWLTWSRVVSTYF